jgi:hypothetical protein
VNGVMAMYVNTSVTVGCNIVRNVFSFMKSAGLVILPSATDSLRTRLLLWCYIISGFAREARWFSGWRACFPEVQVMRGCALPAVVAPRLN